MNRVCLTAAAILTLTAATSSAFAQNQIETQPGMWEYSLETKMPGMAIPPQTMRRCITAQDVAQNKQLIGGNQGKNPCTISNFKSGGGKISFEFACKSGQGTMKGNTSGNATATSIDMETRMQMVPAVQGMSDMSQKTKAKRVGNC
ncbi:MAG: hypothetical protein H6R18_2545 [Proteobacteria bacterium]|nr:hypothetical protein [Pseudomonadota bacterium]